MNKRARRAIGLGLAGAIGVVMMTGLGGCKNSAKGDYNTAVQENTELRDRIETLQSSVREANEQTAQAQTEANRLASENQRLQSDLSQARSGTSSAQRQDAAQPVREQIELAGDTLFAPGSATLRNEAKASLDRIASRLNSEFAGRTIRVEGYTDTDPLNKSRAKWESNEHLSAMRALAVENYLVSKGVSNGRIYSAGFGPAAPRSTKAASRRVEIVILHSGG